MVPLSIFRGRPWPGPGEPLFTDDDRRWALAWQFDTDSRLPCGCYPDETTGIDNDDMFVAVPTVCHRHRAIGEAAEARQRNATRVDSSHGLMWRTQKVD